MSFFWGVVGFFSVYKEFAREVFLCAQVLGFERWELKGACDARFFIVVFACFYETVFV